jgi:hypothetical protein
MKKISDEALELARMTAALPVRKVTETTLRVFTATADIHAAKLAGTDAGPAWALLRAVLDEAVAKGDYTAFDEASKAWEKFTPERVEAVTATLTFPGGEPPIVISQGEFRPTLRLVTIAMIEAIERLQDRRNRAPTRQEILDEIDETIDETELARQLTRLGWNGLLS